MVRKTPSCSAVGARPTSAYLPDEAIGEALIGHTRHSEAIRGTMGHSVALKAMRGTVGNGDAIRVTESHSARRSLRVTGSSYVSKPKSSANPKWSVASASERAAK
jgi:hypothetical protein